jgi:hypothetical protein
LSLYGWSALGSRPAIGKVMTKISNKLTAAQIVSGLIISVGEARKLLGKDARGLTDDDIALYVMSLTEIAPELLNASILLRKQL